MVGLLAGNDSVQWCNNNMQVNISITLTTPHNASNTSSGDKSTSVAFKALSQNQWSPHLMHDMAFWPLHFLTSVCGKELISLPIAQFVTHRRQERAGQRQYTLLWILRCLPTSNWKSLVTTACT